MNFKCPLCKSDDLAQASHLDNSVIYFCKNDSHPGCFSILLTDNVVVDWMIDVSYKDNSYSLYSCRNEITMINNMAIEFDNDKPIISIDKFYDYNEDLDYYINITEKLLQLAVFL